MNPAPSMYLWYFSIVCGKIIKIKKNRYEEKKKKVRGETHNLGISRE